MAVSEATKTLMEIRDLQVHFALHESFKSRVTGRGGRAVKAVDGVSFDLHEGEVLGLVGESGSGKTTLGRALLGLVRPTGGSVKLRGEELAGLPERQLRPKRRHLQMVFQDPHASLNPGMTLETALSHPLQIHKLTKGDAETKAKVREVLELVNLSPVDQFAYRLPAGYSDEELAPLLCAGIIGYRALERAALPTGGRLGIYGFGGSAHLTAQVAVASGARVHVFTRSPRAQKLALELGALSAGNAADGSPEPLDSAIVFAPDGGLVPVALRALERGGTLAVAGIYLTDIPALNYERELFQERTLRSVTSNTRSDGRRMLGFAARHRMRVQVDPYPMDRAAEALADLAAGRVTGAAVLTR